MKKKTGINPDYADFDELDLDALEVAESFDTGQYSFEELVEMVGREEAERVASSLQMDDDYEEIDSLFDDPSIFDVDDSYDS